MKRLFGCTVTMVYEEPAGFARVSSFVADKHEFWWNERKPNESSLWKSKIRLGATPKPLKAHPRPEGCRTAPLCNCILVDSPPPLQFSPFPHKQRVPRLGPELLLLRALDFEIPGFLFPQG